MKYNFAFASFSVDDLEETRDFYNHILGLEASILDDMGVEIKLKDGGQVFAYPKENHVPASFTVLNFEVDNIEESVNELSAKGIEFEHYDEVNGVSTDEKGIMRGKELGMGPDIAWFKDPSDNLIAIIQSE